MMANLITSLPMLVCFFWVVLLLLDALETRQTAKWRLLTFMAVATLLYGGHHVYFNRLTWAFPLTDTIYCVANLAVFPLYYLYIKTLTQPVWNRRWAWLLLLPAVIVGTAAGVVYALMSADETASFVSGYLYQDASVSLEGLAQAQAAIHTVGKVVFALQIPPIIFLGLRHIRHYNQLVEASYADTEGKTMRRIHAALVLLVVISMVSFTANIIGRTSFANSLWLLAIPSLLFSTLLFTLAYVGYRQQFTISDVVSDMHITKDDEANLQAEEATDQRINMDKLLQSVVTTISTEQLYLQPNLKVTDLAERLHTNRTYISKVINEKLNTTFADYINHQRIDYACRLMKQHPQMSTAEVARLSGFSSQSSFYRNFKLYTNHSPKDPAVG